MHLRRLAYVSTASHAMSDAELRKLLDSCRQHNSRLRLSGYLHYHRGSFIQVLEGLDRSVQDAFDRIRNDPRHHDLHLLFDEAVSRRTFANWSMGCSCEARLTEPFLRRIQASIDKLRSLDNILPNQVLLLCDQLMQAGPLEAAA
jgi:hypothetical protein